MKIANITNAIGVKAVKVLDSLGNVIWSGGGGLPAGYTECEYLESTGTQWINTGINAAYVGDVAVDFVLMDSSIAAQTILGVYGGGVNFYPATIRNSDAVFRYRETWPIAESPAATNKDYHFKWHCGDDKIITCISNGLTIYKATDRLLPTSIGSVFYMFALNSNGAVKYNAHARIKSVKIDIIGSKAEFIPALDPSGRPCMFDLVSQQPFYNEGTGEFLYKVK